VATFTITRPNGRSNQEVVLQLVAGGKPGDVYSYEQLTAALEADTETQYPRQAVAACVRSANWRLLREHKRVLRVVRNVGYRLAAAGEHTELSSARHRRADRQMRWALATLRGARLEEMDATQRAQHTAMTVIAAQVAEHTRTLRYHGKLIADLTHRLDDIT